MWNCMIQITEGKKQMPLKQRVQAPEMILQAAFDVLKRDGMEGINARSIAREAQCSTQPVFSCFPTLNDIKTEIVARAVQSYTDTIEPAFQSEQPLEDACKLRADCFAHENPKRSSCISLSIHSWEMVFFLGEEKLFSRLQAGVEASEKLRSEKAKELLELICPYAHGLAIAQATEVMSVPEKTAFERLRRQCSMQQGRTSNNLK